MSQEKAVPVALTRRAIRESERAAARAAALDAAVAGAEPAPTAPRATAVAGAPTAVPERPLTRAELHRGVRRAPEDVVPVAPAGPVGLPAGKMDAAGHARLVLTAVPAPDHGLSAPAPDVGATQATAGPGEVPQAPATGAAGRWVPRAAVLGALGAVTIAGPLTGGGAAAGADPTPTEASPVALPQTEPTAADTLADSATAIRAADVLTADPTAATRAMTSASRTYLREALECPVQSGANGTLSAVMGGEEVDHVVMPVAAGSYRITSNYGFRTYPIYGMHEGTDFAGALGTPLQAVADGVVTYAGGPRDGRSGNIVVIRSEVDGEVVDFWYGHMYTSGVYVTEGQEVGAGEVIGEIGNAGNSTGPHLHFEVHPGGGDTADPLTWLARHDAESLSAAACSA